MFEAPEGEEPWGELFFSIFFTLATITSLLTFGTLALVLARPQSEGGKANRRVGLGVLGVVCLLTGISFLGSAISIEGSWIFFGPVSLFTVPTGILALFALARDVTVSEPPGGWPKILGLIAAGLVGLCALPFVIDLGELALPVVGGLIVALAGAYFLFSDGAPASDETGDD
jgi:hypothetical protein